MAEESMALIADAEPSELGELGRDGAAAAPELAAAGETPAAPPEKGTDAAGELPADGRGGDPSDGEGNGKAEGAADGEAAEPAAAETAATADVSAPLPPDSLETLVAAHPALAAAVEGSAELKAALTGLVAGQKDLSAFLQVFATAEEAKQAASSAQFLAGVDRLYYSNDPAAPRQFLQQLYDSQFVRDPDSGQMLHDASGAPVSSGAYGRITGAYRELLFESLSEQAAKSGDEALASAVRLIRQRMNGETATEANGGREAAGAAQADLPAEIQQRLQRLESLERQAQEAREATRRQETATRQGQTQQELAALAQTVGAAIRADIEQSLGAAALPPYLKAKVADDIFSALNQQAAADPAFQARMDALLRLAAAPGGTDATRARIVAAARAHAKPRLGAVAQRILAEAGAGLREQQEAIASKIAAQRRQAEVKSGGGAPAPVRRSTPSQVQQLEQSLGRRLSDREILDL